jgi:hypothetical protein
MRLEEGVELVQAAILLRDTLLQPRYRNEDRAWRAEDQSWRKEDREWREEDLTWRSEEKDFKCVRVPLFSSTGHLHSYTRSPGVVRLHDANKNA